MKDKKVKWMTFSDMKETKKTPPLAQKPSIEVKDMEKEVKPTQTPTETTDS